MKAMMTAMMTAAIKRRLFIFLPSACLWGLGLLWLGSQGAPSVLGSVRRGHRAQRGQGPTRQWCGVCKAGVPRGPPLLQLPEAEGQHSWGWAWELEPLRV